jgi:glycosyltransferase involved in cell wall biosynthesis
MRSVSNSRITLSIITCTFNSAKYLNQLLESVTTQKEKPFEHIFVDGGSSDTTLSQIQNYSKVAPYSVEVVSDEGTGISNAMNLGASLAQGSHILFLHSDDYLNSTESLKSLFAELDQESDWFISNCIYVDSENLFLKGAPKIPRDLGDLIRRNTISHPSTVMKSSFLKSLGLFDISLKLAMDYDLWLKAIRASQPQQSESVLSNFRIHQSGASSSQLSNLAKETLRVRLRHALRQRDRLFAALVFVFELTSLRIPNFRRIALKVLGKS